MTQWNPALARRHAAFRPSRRWDRSAIIATILFAVTFVAMAAGVWIAAAQVDPATLTVFVP